jgi:glycosyltransferase involved in cell wall biosynthesis
MTELGTGTQQRDRSAGLAAPTAALLPITVVVLTHNEEANLNACLESVAGWTSSIFIVDSGSTDQTRRIADQYGSNFFHHAFESHTRQWRWALDQLPLSGEWVLALDADQRVTPELRDELFDLFQDRAEKLDGIAGLYFKRRQVFRGRWIRHGGYYPKYLLKLFRRSMVLLDEGDLVDHHFYVIGRTFKSRCDIIEENHKEDDITFWIDKHNQYASRLAEEELRRIQQLAVAPLTPSLLGSPDQRSLWRKAMWSRLPQYVRPFLYFVYRYFLRLGFLDRKQGFIFHFLQAFWFRLLVDIKLDEAKAKGSE